MISPELSRRLAAAVQTVSSEVRARVAAVVVAGGTDDEVLAELKSDPQTSVIFTTGR